MKKLLVFALACMMIISSVSAVFANEDIKISAVFFYVATDGDDANDGSRDKPFRTLEAALNAAKGEADTVVINIRGGNYQMTETIKLGAEDSDLVIRAYNNEKVMLTGGTVLPFDAFQKCTDEAFLNALVTKSAKSKIVCANIKELGVTDLGEMKLQGYVSAADMGYSPTLTYNDEALTIARYPNEGYLYTQTILNEGSSGDLYFKTESGAGARKIEFTLGDDRIKKWSGKDLWALGYYRVDWAEALTPAEITAKGSIITYMLSNHTPLPNRRVYFYNIPEELDAPGEWYLDRETGVLYMIPAEGMKAGDTLVYNSYNKNLFDIIGAKNIEISGLVLNGTCAMGMNVKESEGIVIDNCEFTCIGNIAVLFDKCKKSGVENSYFHDLGSFGVNLKNCGDRVNLVSGECFVKNSHFRTFSQIKRTYAPAVNITNDMGTVVSHCEFHDAPHFALQYLGNDIIIEYNDFYDVCQDTADTGAVYTGRHWETRGNEIRYNYFHDMTEVETTTGMHKMAVYLDDTHASTRVHGNIFYRVDSVALMGGGRYNQFTNNVMVDCLRPLVFDERGLTWQYEQAWLDKNDPSSTYQLLEAFPYKEGIWAEKYPELATILEDDPVYPKYNTLKNNVFYKTPEFNLYENVKKYGTIENNIEISSTKEFVDYRNKNFAFKEDSEVFKKIPEFENIPVDKMGRYDYTPVDKYVEKTPEAPSDDTIKVKLNGEKIDFADVAPKVINDRTMVPLRAIFEALGASVEWDDATKTVTAKKGDVSIKMTIGADSFKKNDESVALDSPATIVDSRTLVPVRAIAESFGSKVGWIAESKTVTIED